MTSLIGCNSWNCGFITINWGSEYLIHWNGVEDREMGFLCLLARMSMGREHILSISALLHGDNRCSAK